MLVCGCGRWMHTEGVEERIGSDGAHIVVRPIGMSTMPVVGRH